MSWFKLTDEERDEWRQNPTTKSFFEEVDAQIQEAKNELATVMLGDVESMGQVIAGRIDGMKTTIKILEADQ